MLRNAPLRVAIVGRPNVGKSTLFNRLAGRKLAIVDDTPGVTRDWAIAEANLAGLPLHVIDTAGFEKGPRESLGTRMLERTEATLKQTDVCLFLVDARSGVTAGDKIVAEVLRKSGKPVILAANKCESRKSDPGHSEAYALGFGEPIALSAEHGLGLGELRDALAVYAQRETASDEDDLTDEADAPRLLRLAIIGRPNVGKSSLLNRLLGETRALTGPEAGITRDTVLAEWQWQGRAILLHDTAGLRRKARIVEKLEKLSVDATLNAVRFADCVVLVINATQPFEKQDLTLADLIAREGRAIVFAINKWDLVEDRQGTLSSLREQADRLLPQIAGAPLIGLSALTGEGVDRLMPAAAEAEQAWCRHVSTSDLNRFLHNALERHPPPAVRGRRIRIRYITQPKVRPPSFALFGNQLKELPQSYLRYLSNALREAFDLRGTPLRFSLRTSKNPYAN